MRPFAGLPPAFLFGKKDVSCIVMLCTLYVISLGWHMSFAVLSPAFRGLQFPFRDMYVLTCHLNSFTGNNGRPSHGIAGLAPSLRLPCGKLVENICLHITPKTKIITEIKENCASIYK